MYSLALPEIVTIRGECDDGGHRKPFDECLDSRAPLTFQSIEVNNYLTIIQVLSTLCVDGGKYNWDIDTT